ncbi:MAG: BAX inhibitor (BI)-1/YccA family protein, partial [Lactobacillus iners]|nr:BAX inhibitor (BI)-1/YccA family protein [Lactobacillus iners]
MNNFENIFQTRRSIVDNVALNRFLTKMYSIV